MTINITPKPEYESQFQKMEYLKLDTTHTVRLLGDFLPVNTHYLPASRAVIKCIGEDCPVCANNKKIFLEHPKDFRNFGYISKSYRHYVNVLDRTPIKVCPACQHENLAVMGAQFAPVCSKCNSFITNVPTTVSNKVKVANLSDTVAKQLAQFQMTILNDDGTPVGLENFDIMLMVIQGERKTTTPMPTQNRDKVEIPAEQLYNLENAVITLYADEIVNLLKGVSLKDVFASRKGANPEDGLAADELEATKNIVDSLVG